jgi:hypothetical protein
MRKLTAPVVVSGMLLIQIPSTWADATRVAQAPATGHKAGAADSKRPGKGAVSAVRVRGTIDAIDKERGTVTLKGPKGRTLTLEVRDKEKLAVGREISLTATITAIDRKGHTVTVKGPEGRTETIAVKDPKNLDGVKVGDLVDVTYAQALAVALDKPAK